MKKNKGYLLLEFSVALALFSCFVSILHTLHTTILATQHHAFIRSKALDNALSILADRHAPINKQYSVLTEQVKLYSENFTNNRKEFFIGTKVLVHYTSSNKQHSITVIGT